MVAPILLVECLLLNSINKEGLNMIGSAKVKGFRQAHRRSRAADSAQGRILWTIFNGLKMVGR